MTHHSTPNPIAAILAVAAAKASSAGTAPESGASKVVAAVPTGSSPVSSADVSALAEQWDAEAAEYQRRFNELTCGARSVGGLEATIATLKKHVEELRRLVASTVPRQPGSNIVHEPHRGSPSPTE